MNKIHREAPPPSLLLRPAIADWPDTLTNGELLTLARRWRALAGECHADKAGIEAWAQQIAPAAAEKPDAGRAWWKFWN